MLLSLRVLAQRCNRHNGTNGGVREVWEVPFATLQRRANARERQRRVRAKRQWMRTVAEPENETFSASFAGFPPLMCHVARRVPEVWFTTLHPATHKPVRSCFVWVSSLITFFFLSRREYNIAVLGSGGVGKSALTGMHVLFFTPSNLNLSIATLHFC